MMYGTKRKARLKRGKTQEKVLVAAWCENYDQIRSSQSREGWALVVDAVNNVMGKDSVCRTLTQCKDKIKNLTAAYWAERKASEKTGSTPDFSWFYHTFDSIHGCRAVATLPEFKEAGLDTSPRNTNPCGSEEPRCSFDPCENESEDLINQVVKEQDKEKENKDNGKKKQKKRDVQQQMLDIQIEQLEYLRESDKKNREFIGELEKQKQSFLAELHKQQKEDDMAEKERDRNFFLQFGQLFK